MVQKTRSRRAKQAHHAEPFHAITLVCVCFGLRISEALALRWSDVDWLNGKLNVQRGVVRQRLDDVKTETSHKAITVTQTMIEALKQWKQLNSPRKRIGFSLPRHI